MKSLWLLLVAVTVNRSLMWPRVQDIPSSVFLTDYGNPAKVIKKFGQDVDYKSADSVVMVTLYENDCNNLLHKRSA